MKNTLFLLSNYILNKYNGKTHYIFFYQIQLKINLMEKTHYFYYQNLIEMRIVKNNNSDNIKH